MARPVKRGVTRWRRTAFLALPAFGALGLMAIATLVFGLMPLNLAVHDLDVRISSNGAPAELPKGLQAVTSYTELRAENDITGNYQGVALAYIPEAILPKGLCLSITTKLPVLGRWTVKLHSNSKVKVTKMVAQADALSAAALTATPGTTDGKPPAADGSNVNRPIILGAAPDTLPSLIGKENYSPGKGWGIDLAGNHVTGGALEASAKGAIIAGGARLGIPTVWLYKDADPGETCVDDPGSLSKQQQQTANQGG